MNIARHLSFLVLASLLASVTTGCTTLQPLHSKPPLSKIILPQPFDADGFMFHVHMPAGEYLPLYEEGSTYYYQAPSKIAIRTIATDYQDGGFFVEAGTKVLHGWWHFNDDGDRTDGYLGTPLSVVYKAIP